MSGAGQIRYVEAIRQALMEEMERDETVCLAGIDIGRAGGVFGVTRGLLEQFGDRRVVDTPISEMGLVGMGVGASLVGLRPVVELMYMDFLGMCLDALLNQAAKLRFMSGDRLTVPFVVRTQFGAGRSGGPQHSQSLEALVAHIPGLKVIMPSTPRDVKGLLKASIRDDNPVVFIENRHLYGMKVAGPLPDEVLPIGRAITRREGSDVTAITYSRMLHLTLEAAESLSHDGIDVEVIDLRTISPLDDDAIVQSVRKTNKAIVIHEAWEAFGVGAEVAARIADAAFEYLDAPVRRVCAPAAPVPFAPSLERDHIPSAARIAEECRSLAAY
jgi:pyruvate/2-oxoglutarate/acetoin dehydrogenase E1 component